MSTVNDFSFQNHTLTKHPTQTHFYPGKISGPRNTATTSNDTLQRKIYNNIPCAQLDQGLSNNASQNSPFSSYEDIVSSNKHCDSYRERSLRSRFYDDPCLLQTSRVTSNTKRSISQGSPYKFFDRYNYNHVLPTNLYDKYTVPSNNTLRSNPYNPCWNSASTHELSSPYNVYTEQTNSMKISPYNSYAEQDSLTNFSQTPPYHLFSEHQREQPNAYKSFTDQCSLINTLQNNYDVFQENIPQTDLYNIYLDQRGINSSMENNSSVTYKEDIPKTDPCSNTHKNQHNSANGHSIQTPPYNACVNQANDKNGSQSNLYGSYYADCFKSNNAVDTTPQNNFYRTFSETCRTPTNPITEPTFYDSYTVPFSIAVTHPSSQSSAQGHHHQRSPPTTLNTAGQRNQFPRQKLANRRTSFQDSNPDSQNKRYVMLREITPEIYHNTKQSEKTFHLPNVCPQATKKSANEQPASTTAKIKHRSAPQRLANTHKKSTVGHGRKTETASQTLISGQDVLLSSYVIDDDGLASEMEGASLKKRGRPFKKISSRLLKCASKSFRDAGKSRTKKSPKWDKRPSEKATLKTKSDALADDMYLWADDFSLEEINNVERSPSSLFLRSKGRHFFENGSESVKELDIEESAWLRLCCQEEINNLKPAWKIFILEPIFQNLIY